MSERLTLFTVTDGNRDDYDPFYEDWECGAYWAKSKESACDQWRANVPPGYEDVSPTATLHEAVHCDVTEEGEERRLKVLRLTGWRFEGESECEACGFYECGLPEYAVCPECYQCRACSDGECEECNESEGE